jgi:hypothetical protein
MARMGYTNNVRKWYLCLEGFRLVLDYRRSRASKTARDVVWSCTGPKSCGSAKITSAEGIYDNPEVVPSRSVEQNSRFAARTLFHSKSPQLDEQE